LRDEGFTLMEILVALAISCLVLAVLAYALHIGYGAVARGKKRSKAFQEVRGAVALFRRQLLNIYDKKVEVEGGRAPFFEGDGSKITFISKAPVEGLIPGGLVIVSYYVRDNVLYLYQKPFTREEDLEDPWKGGTEVPLIKGVSLFKVRFLNNLDWDEGFEEGWEEEWKGGDLPQGVDLTLEAGGFSGECFVAFSQEG